MTSQRPFASLPLVLGTIGLVISSGCSGGTEDAASAETNASTEPEQPPHNVRVLDLQRTDLEEYLLITGPLRARRATDVSTEEAGVVEALVVEKGKLVKAGGTIVRLDRRLLEAEKKSAEAAVTLREYNNERTRSLLDANSVSKQEMLIVHTELEQARQAARIAALRYERAAIPAPFAGIVVDHYVETGQLVSPGQRVARVVDPFRLELEGSVTEREVSFVEEGAPALVTVEGVDGMIPAEVSWVSFEANPVSGKFEVEIQIDNRDLRVRAGVVGRARVLTQLHADEVVIPRDAVVRGDAGLRVFVVEGDRAVPRTVTLGADQGMMVIASSGLDGGERLVVRGQRQLNPNGRVQVQEVATARDGSLPGDPPEVREHGALEWMRELGSGRRTLEAAVPAGEPR